MTSTSNINEVDVVLVGAGIMSATLGVLLKELQPDLKIQIFERLDQPAVESSAAWNNAGTGHSAYCELNYTPEKADGTIDITKAINICESFGNSRQFWTYLVNKGIIKDPKSFINSVPHMSFVWGDKNVSFLEKRFEALKQFHMFKDMEFSKDAAQIKQWAPLIIEGRPTEKEAIAATFMKLGTDVNFGALTKELLNYLTSLPNVSITYNASVDDLTRVGTNWQVAIATPNKKVNVLSKFVFVGAGGGSLHLLQKSKIKEIDGFGGFPVGGQWLRCTNSEIIAKHHAKVYGQASVGAPPMSVPHLDTRTINGKSALLFGPFAGFSTKFLKNGSYSDLFKSINAKNIGPIIQVGLDNMDLTKYLIKEVLKSHSGKVEALKEYFPDANGKDWKIEIAGQRVQVIKKDKNGKGVLQFGTEVVSSADGSIAGLLGASPGASTTVSIMLKLIKTCFPELEQQSQDKLKEMIPSYGLKLRDHEALSNEILEKTSKALQLDF
ncbi:malate:quinone oxidoreductase [Flavobacterium agricola]|uniref:Probable malate:quinone oxidoreductase n=1 Tax=Flavobacterium agricola TaxID=2870839 RepID=A0ABY6M0E1_9FLAO|nr:malate:quinone oxidoreductase [Flavobacterium agricola]UYW00338.1 malate:quinone oxidoreductase [Flavobacterium agricola]